MAKDTIVQYSTTAGSNTDIQSVNIAEACPPSGINNAIREVMVDLAELSSGAQSLANLKTTGTTQIAAGAVGAPSLSFSADLNTGIWQSAADSLSVSAGGEEQFRFGSNPIPGGSKNLIINGEMMVNQRGSVTATVNTPLLDMFASTLYNAAGSAVATVTKDSDSPAGFGSSMKFDVTTIATGGGDYNYVRQRIEGQNLQHLKYGTADALTCTFSFWFKTTITGIYSATAWHIDASQTYVREFTVQSSNTWEFFQVTFPGYTSTAFDNDANASLEIGIVLASDSATASSNNVWQAGGDTGGSINQVNGLSSTSNNIYTTGWQLEVGEIATSYAHESYGTVLARCLRYLYRLTRKHPDADTQIAAGEIATTTLSFTIAHFPVAMRASPTTTVSAAGDLAIRHANTLTTVTSFTAYAAGERTALLQASDSGAALVAGRGCLLYLQATDDYIQFSAEL